MWCWLSSIAIVIGLVIGLIGLGIFMEWLTDRLPWMLWVLFGLVLMFLTILIRRSIC